MVKDPKKANKTPTNTINSILPANKTPPKSRQQIYQANYQKNQAKKKAQQKERYAKKKQAELAAQQGLEKYYAANSIKVLLTFKDYSELNQSKHQLWLEFAWTLQACQQGISDIIQIMKLRETAENLINDYWATAKKGISKGKSWNILSEEQQSKLIKYWASEKAHKEQGLVQQLAEQEQNAKAFEKELERSLWAFNKDQELAKFHEERGKIKCACYDCETRKDKQELFKDENNPNQEQCQGCRKLVKELDEGNGICQSCVKKYE